MNIYQQKQEARKERYKKLSEQAKKKAKELSDKGWGTLHSIPLGQPILVGHHSEKADRKRRNKAISQIDKSIEEDDKAEYYEQKAESVGKGGISADDPEAIQKLKTKLADLEKTQTRMKELNAQARKAKQVKPFPSWQLSNHNAVIRNTKKRIETLQRQAEMTPQEDIKGEGWTIKENKELNRIQIFFTEKPEKNIISLVKSHGFRWSRYHQAWQRMLNANGRFNTGLLLKHLRLISI